MAGAIQNITWWHDYTSPGLQHYKVKAIKNPGKTAKICEGDTEYELSIPGHAITTHGTFQIALEHAAAILAPELTSAPAIPSPPVIRETASLELRMAVLEAKVAQWIPPMNDVAIADFTEADFQNIVAHLSPDLVSKGKLPNPNSLMMEFVRLRNAYDAMSKGRDDLREENARLRAHNTKLKLAARTLDDHYERNICHHESTYRGGSIWTVCHDCGGRWADDRGGFKPFEYPAEVNEARAVIQLKEGE